MNVVAAVDLQHVVNRVKLKAIGTIDTMHASYACYIVILRLSRDAD